MSAQVHLYTFNNPDAICSVVNYIEYEIERSVYELSNDINHMKMHLGSAEIIIRKNENGFFTNIF